MLKLKHLSKMINFSVVMAGAGLSAGLVYAANSNLSVDELNSVATSKTAETPFGVAGLGVPKLVMLTMGREHNLFSEAYSDYTDIDGDGKLDIMFDPSINYYGIFESKYCYKYSEDTSRLVNAGTMKYIGNKTYGYFWIPVGLADAAPKTVSLSIWADTDNPKRTVGTCPGEQWSGNFLNYVTSSRIDVMKKALYGGTRFSNNSSAAAIATKDTKPVRYKDDQGNYSSLIAHSRVLRDAHAWGKVLGDGMYQGKLTVNDFTKYPATGNNTDAYFFAMSSYDWNEGTDGHRWLPFGMRVGKVQCAGMPGVDSASNTCGSTNYAYIWDWVSRQTADSGTSDAIASENQKRIDANGNVTGDSLFVEGKVDNFNIVTVSCTKDYHDTESCKNYGTESHPVWQPIGILQQYGEGERPPLKFGLITGSWESNLSGGALRANIDNFSNEIYYKTDNTNVNDFISGDINVTGVQCTDSDLYCGIIPTLDRFSIYSRSTGNKDTKYKDCERHVNDLVNLKDSGSCKDWGNPIGSILYQSARYFKNTDLINYDKEPNEKELGIGYVKRKAPIEKGSPDYCTWPTSLVIADENISFDSPEFNDQINGGDTGAVKAETESIKIKKGKYFVGGIKETQNTDPEFFIPSLKEVSNLAQVIGIAPGVAYSYGSYNVAGVAKLYGQNPEAVTFTGPNNEEANRPIQTFVVAMQPNVPQINIPIDRADGKQTTVTILPFAKTVADLRFSDDFIDSDESKDAEDNNKNQGTHAKTGNRQDWRKRQSTNQVADFYVETLGPDHGVFRINYEDFQYGSDYDMDWVVEYKYQIINSGNDTYIRVQLKEIDSDAYAPQHAGYVITGVEHSGVYVDLAKSAYDHRGRAANLYELDNVIGDSAILGCANSANSSSLDLKSYIKNDNNCLFQTFNEEDYDYYITGANVANYYNLVNSNGVRQYYYGNRNTIEDYHGEDICQSNNPYYAKIGKCRLIGDCYRRFDKCVSKSGKKGPRSLADNDIRGSSPADRNYTSSRLFKVNSDSADNHWLKSPLWYAAKFGLSPELVKNDGKTDVDPVNYTPVTDPTKLRDGIIHMLNLLDNNYYSGSSFVLKGTTIDSEENPYAYATVYGPKSWYGNLVKVHYDKNYQYTNTTAWEAYETFANANVDERLIVTNDYFNNKIVRLYAEDIDYKSSPASSEYQSYASSSKNSGALKYIGHDLFRTIINENVSDEIIDGNTAYLAYVDKLIRWMNGESKYEGDDTTANDNIRLARNNNTPLRKRSFLKDHYVLGDIINSDAVVFDVSDKTFVAVGANDGMIHIIDDRNGNPVVSYVPSVMLSSLGELVKQNYTGAGHRAFVDSTPKVFVDKFNGNEDVYLYGTYGLGFKGGYVLNMNEIAVLANMDRADEKFNRISTGPNKMLVWEMTEAMTLRDQDGDEVRTMGSNYIGKQRVAPSIILKAATKPDERVVPYLVFGSGYDHESENAGLVLVDMLYRDDLNDSCMIEDGEHTASKNSLKSAAIPCITRIIPISEGESDVKEDPWGFNNSNNEWVGRKNVLSPVSDYTSSSINEYATNTGSMHYGALYFGDLFGRVWKIDLSELDATSTDNNEYLDVQNWGKENTPSEPQVIFRAVDANDVAQPITTSVAVGYHPQSGVGLIFGTGSLWTVADRSIISKKYNESQSLYMIRDMSNFTATGNINASDLAKSGYPVRRCNPFSYAETAHCLIPLVESEYKAKEKETDSAGNEYEAEHVYRKISMDPSIQATSIKNIYGWYFDLNGFDENDKGQARIYVDPQVISSKYMSVAVNIPDFSDSCDDKGSSYIIRGNWSTDPTKIEIYTTVKLGYQVNSGNLYLDSFGRLVDIYQGTPAHANHPDITNSHTWNNRISRTSSWLKLY